MYRQHYLPTTGPSTVAATGRRWSRRLVVVAAACVLGLLPGPPSLAPAGSAVVQAAQPDQSHPAAPAGSLAGAVPPTSAGPKDYAPNLITQSTGAPDEQLDVAAALDQGARLFLLQARYQDAGNGQADYYLAGPQGVSHQPLRALFAPLDTWLAAPAHEHEMVMLGLRTDPRSANPARFDTTCQAFASTLGPYLLEATDLPAGKSFAELTPGERAALQSRPRVVTDWSACTGEAPPLARHKQQLAAAVPLKDHWMADQKDIIGQRPLRQVVIPGSHDAATYDEDSSCPANACWPGGPFETWYAQAQSQDITAQLNAGSRYFDLRFSYADFEGYGGKEFYVFHGTDKNDAPYISVLKMGKVLYDILVWINQPGHEREIVWLDMQVYREDQDPSWSKTVCNNSLGWALGQREVIQSSMLPPNTALTDMSMNEIWALPGQPRIIVTGWSSCTGNDPMTKGGAYADQCTGEEVWDTISPELYARKDWMTRNLVTGAYALDIQSTPGTNDCGANSIQGLADQQWTTLWNLGKLDGRSRANLNIVAGDYLGDPEGEGTPNWPIVQTALDLNQSSSPETLSWTQEIVSPGAPVTVSCKPLSPKGPGPTTMVVYPVVQGPQSPNLKTFTPDQSGSLQGTVSRSDFPGAGAAPDGSYLVAACARGGSPLDPPGSSAAEISRIVIPYQPFVTVPDLEIATPADPVDLPFTCSAPVTQGSSPIQVRAWPTGDELSPYAQTFIAPAGQSPLQATYSRRSDYDVSLECVSGGASQFQTVPKSAFPPALTIWANATDRWLYCKSAPQVNSVFGLSLVALIPDPPQPLSAAELPDKKEAVLVVKPDYFPFGNYLLVARCVSDVSSGESYPWTATPLILSSRQISTLKVIPKITGCSKQGDKAYTCALRVALGAPLAVNTVFSVDIEGGALFNPSGGDRPQVTASPGCQYSPNPSPYLVDGKGNYTGYDVNISTDGCTAGAVVTFGEAVTGAAGATMTQPVTVPGLGASTATFVLP